MASTATLLGQFQLDGGIDPISVNATGYSALVVGFCYDDGGAGDWVTSATFNSTSLGSKIVTHSGGNGQNIHAWRVTNPAQTTANVQVTRDSGSGGLTQGRVLVVGIAGGNTTEACGTPAVDDAETPFTDVSAQATDGAADLWLAFFCANASSLTVNDGGSQTSLQNAAFTSGHSACSHKASDTMSYSYTPSATGNASMAVIPIRAASGGGTSLSAGGILVFQ